MRCDECGRFARRLVDISVGYATPDVDHRACEECAAEKKEAA